MWEFFVSHLASLFVKGIHASNCRDKKYRVNATHPIFSCRDRFNAVSPHLLVPRILLSTWARRESQDLGSDRRLSLGFKRKQQRETTCADDERGSKVHRYCSVQVRVYSNYRGLQDMSERG